MLVLLIALIPFIAPIALVMYLPDFTPKKKFNEILVLMLSSIWFVGIYVLEDRVGEKCIEGWCVKNNYEYKYSLKCWPKWNYGRKFKVRYEVNGESRLKTLKVGSFLFGYFSGEVDEVKYE